MRIGISLLRARPSAWLDIAVAADELGYDAVWLSDHLVIPVERRGSYPGDNVASPAATIGRQGPTAAWPVIDAPTMLAAIAARTTRIRLGTYVYLLGLRHPLSSARVWTTVDMISAGRVLLGVGAGWLESEWAAAGLDWRTRGQALDEAIGVCRRLWREAEVEHRGQTWSFEPVTFEPKPVQPGGPPIHVGGESEAAQRRAVRCGDGWIALEHTPATIRPKVERLRALLAAAGRDARDVPVTAVGVAETAEDVAAWSEAGVDHLIVTPWRRSATAVDDLAEYARRLGIGLH